MRARLKRAFVPCLALAVAAATLVGVPAGAQTDGPVRVVAFPSTSSDSAIRVAAVVSVDLCAKEGSITLPDTVDPVPIWGFALKPSGVPCTDASVVAGLPGPVISIDEGDVLTVTLHNALAENVSLAFPGQDLTPDFTGAAPGGTAAYTFTADDPGTYLYASGENPAIQVPMGLSGALVVRSSVAGTAYGTSASSFNREGVLVLSEIDLSLNADPGGFNPLDWHPTYWLVNGKAYPDTTTISGTPGGETLLRYVNAGLEHHTPMLLGLHQRVFAKDATPLNFPFDAVAETIPAGQTADMIVEIPGAATVGQTFPLYSRQLHVTNGDNFPGGMLTFLEVQAAGPRPVVGVDIRSVSASARAHRVRVSARTVGCSPCEARARLKVGGSWRVARMSRVDGAFVRVFRNVPSGLRAYQVTIEDLDTGISVTSERRFIRVR